MLVDSSAAAAAAAVTAAVMILTLTGGLHRGVPLLMPLDEECRVKKRHIFITIIVLVILINAISMYFTTSQLGGMQNRYPTFTSTASGEPTQSSSDPRLSEKKQRHDDKPQIRPTPDPTMMISHLTPQSSLLPGPNESAAGTVLTTTSAAAAAAVVEPTASDEEKQEEEEAEAEAEEEEGKVKKPEERGAKTKQEDKSWEETHEERKAEEVAEIDLQSHRDGKQKGGSIWRDGDAETKPFTELHPIEDYPTGTVGLESCKQGCDVPYTGLKLNEPKLVSRVTKTPRPLRWNVIYHLRKETQLAGSKNSLEALKVAIKAAVESFPNWDIEILVLNEISETKQNVEKYRELGLATSRVWLCTVENSCLGKGKAAASRLEAAYEWVDKHGGDYTLSVPAGVLLPPDYLSQILTRYKSSKCSTPILISARGEETGAFFFDRFAYKMLVRWAISPRRKDLASDDLDIKLIKSYQKFCHEGNDDKESDAASKIVEDWLAEEAADNKRNVSKLESREKELTEEQSYWGMFSRICPTCANTLVTVDNAGGPGVGIEFQNEEDVGIEKCYHGCVTPYEGEFADFSI